MEKQPYGFWNWLNKVYQIGFKKGIWSFPVTEYKERLDVEAWKQYFMIGLSPSQAVDEDINEQH